MAKTPYACAALEIEFGDRLRETGRGGGHDLSVIHGVVHLPIHRCGAIELRVVERVEAFDAEFERSPVLQTEVFLERQIEVLDSRTLEGTTLGVAQCTFVFFRE